MKNERIHLYSETWSMRHLLTQRRVTIEGMVYGLGNGLEVVVNLDSPANEKIPLFGEIRVTGRNWLHTMSSMLDELRKLDLTPVLKPEDNWPEHDYTSNPV